MSRGGYVRQAQEFASDLRLRAKGLVLGPNRCGSPASTEHRRSATAVPDRSRASFRSSSEHQKTERDDIG